MIYIAAVLAAFLFYKFVPKNHKILSAKIIGSLAIVIGVFIIIFSWREDLKYKERQEGITSEFLYLKKNNLKKEVALKICNKREFPMMKYSITVSGLREGRSTKFKLLKDYSEEGSTSFKSDIIVPPKDCAVLSWEGEFIDFNKYESYPETYTVVWDEK